LIAADKTLLGFSSMRYTCCISAVNSSNFWPPRSHHATT